MIRLALNTATTRRQWDLGEAIEGCQRHGFTAIAPWRDQVEALGVGTAARGIRDAGLEVTGYCRGGMFPAATTVLRKAAIDDNRRMIEQAAELGAPVLVLVCGGLVEGSRDLGGARQMVEDGIAAIIDDARSAGVKLAIEPLHPMQAADRSCINTLAQALDLCDALDGRQGDVLGVAVDAYHVWWDPRLETQLQRAGAARLLGFHLCDWQVPTRHLVTDRGMMGDGVIDLLGMADSMQRAGYDGTAEVEIFSEYWWSRPGDEVMTLCRERAAPIIARLNRIRAA